uniref:Uncharacterized protein LOC117311888 n=1 Tax=Tursiops truncatus TaxID=9739 RepID=A0A6J3R814_TURTR|nr:uncharacterized protein LOC117311888 [Tursiops truncatus]
MSPGPPFGLQMVIGVGLLDRALAGRAQQAQLVAAEGGQWLAVHGAHALWDGRRRVQAPRHLGHLGERSVGSQVPLRGQLAALGARVRALGLAPAAPDALAAEVVAAVGHHRIRKVVEADGAGGLLLEVGGQVRGGHGTGGTEEGSVVRRVGRWPAAAGTMGSAQGRGVSRDARCRAPGDSGASERKGSGVQGCATPGMRNIRLRDCRGSENVGPRNTVRREEEESKRGRKQEAAGVFLFFPLEQPTLAPDWPWPVTRPAGRTELEVAHPLTLRRRRRLRCCLWAVAVLHGLASPSGLGKGPKYGICGGQRR